jgi:hypothetical protein
MGIPETGPRKEDDEIEWTEHAEFLVLLLRGC